MSKEEKLDKLLELEHHLTLMFDSDVSVAMTLQAMEQEIKELIKQINQNKDEYNIRNNN